MDMQKRKWHFGTWHYCISSSNCFYTELFVNLIYLVTMLNINRIYATCSLKNQLSVFLTFNHNIEYYIVKIKVTVLIYSQVFTDNSATEIPFTRITLLTTFTSTSLSFRNAIDIKAPILIASWLTKLLGECFFISHRHFLLSHLLHIGMVRTTCKGETNNGSQYA